MFRHGKTLLLALIATLAACTHPLDSEGEGDILSYSGKRNCMQGEFPCEIVVVDDYADAYAGVAAPGYVFVGWRNCNKQFPWCSFNVPAATVKNFWGQVMPPLVAVFRSINLLVKNPVEGGVLSQSGNEDCPAGQTCVIKGSDTKGFGQVFTAEPSEGYRFAGWGRDSANPFCIGSTYPCEITDGWASSIAQSDVWYAAQRGWLNIEEDREIELAPTFKALDPGSLAGGNDRRVDIPSALEPSPGAIATLSDGKYVIVRTAHDAFSVGVSVIAQLFDQEGAPVGQEIHVSNEAITYKVYPHVVALTSNRFLVSWQTSRANYGGSDIVARIFDVNGVPIADEMNITASDYRPEFSSPINAAKPDGGFAITWHGYGWGSFEGTNGQHFDASGQPVGEPMRFGIEGDYAARIAYFSDGGSVTGWARTSRGYYNSPVNLRCLSPDGQLIRETTAGNYEQFIGNIVVLNDNAFLLTWNAVNRDDVPWYGTAESGVYARLFSRDCIALTNEIQVNTYAYGSQYGSQAVRMSDGGFAIAWTSESHTLDSSPSVFIQRFNAAGQKVGNETLVNSYTPYYQSDIDITALDNGDIVAVWYSNDQHSSEPRLMSKHLSIDSDGDLLPDKWEQEQGLDPAFPYDALLDTDSDGKHNLDEFMEGSNPLLP